MKTYCPSYWTRSASVDYSAAQLLLSDIAPRPGETVSVFLPDEQRPSDGEIVQLIWMPPFSEMNGWSEQPSEIKHSYMIIGTIRKTEIQTRTLQSPEIQKLIISRSIEWQFDIVERTPFIQACAQAASINPGEPSPASSILFLEAPHWSGVAVVQGYTYLCATLYESHIQLLLKQEAGTLVSYFQEHTYPGGFQIEVGRRSLPSTETLKYQEIVNKANALKDTFEAYLADADIDKLTSN